MNSPASPADGDALKTPPKPDDSLPPVQAPNAAFILQLFLIPAVIVSIIVCVWLMFSWLAHMGNDPQKLVQDIRKMNSASWQKALVLANMLRNDEYDHLKDDSQLAGELAGLLNAQLAEPGEDDRSIKLRRFLCRAIGEFRTPEGMPVLLIAATQEQNERDVEVRRSALAAIAILSSNVGSERALEDPEVLKTLIAASKERAGNEPQKTERAALRSTAAFALGVVGGPEAADRLAKMTMDSEPDVRYNAAIGLARSGDVRSVGVLKQMLDPENKQAVRGEASDAARERKRLDVMGNAIRAIVKLKEQNSAWDSNDIRGELEALANKNELNSITLEAKAALAKLSDNSDSKSPQ